VGKGEEENRTKNEKFNQSEFGIMLKHLAKLWKTKIYSHGLKKTIVVSCLIVYKNKIWYRSKFGITELL